MVVVLSTDEQDVRVPVQVKSSVTKAKAYRKKYPTYLPVHHIILVVVNESKTDEILSLELETALEHIIKNGITFEEFFKKIDTPKAEYDIRPFVKEHLFLDKTPMLGARKKIRFTRFFPTFF